MRYWEIKEAEESKIVAVMPGGFHPFHPGHKSLYDWATKTFGKENVYVAATNDTKSRPFPFDIKQKLATMAGVPSDKFIQVTSPFNALSYQAIIGNPANTSLIFVRSEKDQGTHPLPDQIRKSDGMPGYLISFTDKENLEKAEAHAHIAYGPTINFNFAGMDIKSATELRNTWPTMSDEDKLKASELMYPGNAKIATELLNQALGDLQLPVGESISEKVDSEIVAPKTIKVMKPINPPKAPDATIPRTRNGYTTDRGVTYTQDKYDEKLMHVSDGGGTYTFDGARMIKWQTPRIKGLKFIYDYVQRKIYMDAQNTVDIKDGSVNIDQLATYDMKGNLIPGSGKISTGAGGFKTSLSKDKVSVDYQLSDGLSVHITGDRNKKPGPEAKKILKDMLAKAKAGENISLSDAMTKFKNADAKVQFRMLGKAIPFSQGIKQLQQAGI